MDWVTLSIIAALGQVLRNASMKSIGHKLDEYINVLGRFAFLLPFAAVAVWLKGVPEIQPGFWWMCILFGFLQTLATLSLSKALLYGSMGVVTSLWKLSIIWLVVLSFITLGETPSVWGFAGIFLTLAGVYGLNVSRSQIGLFEPVRTLFTDKGMRYTVLSSLLYAPSVITFKQAAVLSDATFGTLATYAAASLVVLPLTLWKSAAALQGRAQTLEGLHFPGFFRLHREPLPGGGLPTHAHLLCGIGEAGRDSPGYRHRLRLLQGARAGPRNPHRGTGDPGGNHFADPGRVSDLRGDALSVLLPP